MKKALKIAWQLLAFIMLVSVITLIWTSNYEAEVVLFKLVVTAGILTLVSIVIESSIK